MQYDYYKYNFHGDIVHYIRVSNNFEVNLVLEDSFRNHIHQIHGHGDVYPTTRYQNGIYSVHFPIPMVVRELTDELNWESAVWNRSDILLQEAKDLLSNSRWFRKSKVEGFEDLIYEFKNGLLFINSTPLSNQYEILEKDETYWIYAPMVKLQIIDINESFLTLYDGRSVFALEKVTI